jgi:hypothetical protein
MSVYDRIPKPFGKPGKVACLAEFDRKGLIMVL